MSNSDVKIMSRNYLLLNYLACLFIVEGLYLITLIRARYRYRVQVQPIFF
jgi:hypothetical protein